MALWALWLDGMVCILWLRGWGGRGRDAVTCVISGEGGATSVTIPSRVAKKIWLRGQVGGVLEIDLVCWQIDNGTVTSFALFHLRQGARSGRERKGTEPQGWDLDVVLQNFRACSWHLRVRRHDGLLAAKAVRMCGLDREMGQPQP